MVEWLKTGLFFQASRDMFPKALGPGALHDVYRMVLIQSAGCVLYFRYVSGQLNLLAGSLGSKGEEPSLAGIVVEQVQHSNRIN